MIHILGKEKLKVSSPTGRNGWDAIPENVFQGVKSNFQQFITNWRASKISKKSRKRLWTPKKYISSIPMN